MYQVLPGDAQVAAFKESAIQGELLVCRECLVEGDLSGDSLDEFFVNRAAFIMELTTKIRLTTMPLWRPSYENLQKSAEAMK